MTSEWVSKKLLDVAKIVGGGTPSTTERSYWDGDVPWITPKDLSNYKDVYISNGGRSITDLGLKESSAKLVPKGTVLFTSRAPIGYVAIASQTVCTNQGFKSLVLNKGYDSRFFYYLLKQYTPEIEAKATGSTFKEISGYALGNFEVVIPDGYIQIKIADFLSAMDDRITLLRETNSTLEAIAQALFKSWFVDFDPVHAKQQGIAPEGLDEATTALFPDGFEGSKLGLIPRGWEIGTLGNWLTVLETGRRPKGGVSGIDSGVPSVGAESIIRIGQFDYSKIKYVSHDFFSKMKSGKLVSRDVLLYKDGGKPGVFLPRVSMFGDGFPFEVCGINEHVFRMRLKEPFNQTFLYFWIWSDAVMHEIKHRGGKAAIPGINQTDVKEQRLLIPTEAVLLKYDELTSPLIAGILSNSTKIQTLTRLRDTLLPRLISGQLRLPEVDSLLEESVL